MGEREREREAVSIEAKDGKESKQRAGDRRKEEEKAKWEIGRTRKGNGRRWDWERVLARDGDQEACLDRDRNPRLDRNKNRVWNA